MNALSLIQATVEPASALSADHVRQLLHVGLHDLGFRTSSTSRDGFIFKDHDARYSIGFAVIDRAPVSIAAYFGHASLLDTDNPVTPTYIRQVLTRTKTLVHNLLRDARSCDTVQEFRRKFEHEIGEFGDYVPDSDRDAGDYFYQMEHNRA